jgi:uncharacterized membrane protein YczE
VSDRPPSARHGTRRLGHRLLQLYVGLVVFAVSEALILQARLGVMPWDVLQQGLITHVGLTMGTWSIIIGVCVLLLWIPLRQKPGVGTVSNAIVIGLVLDPALRLLPAPESIGWRAAYLLGGILLNGIATAAYIGARLGPGPRDGLMTGLVARTGRSVRSVRTAIEVTVVVVGWLLGGNLGIGTVVFALAIGPVVHVALPRLTVPDDRAGRR